MIIGLTGPSGAGKSTAAALLDKAGFRIIDSDGLVHGLYADPRCAGKIAEVFGKDYLRNGEVDRKKLAALVFSDREALIRLNRAVSPFILHAIMAEIENARTSGADAVLDAPLLFEYALETMCDVTLGIVADPAIAAKRLSARDARSESEIRARLSAQHDNNFFRTHCDFILENNESLDAFAAAFAKLLPAIRAFSKCNNGKS